ncbi:MAG: radical SAM protein [Spirochaetia bacterium]
MLIPTTDNPRSLSHRLFGFSAADGTRCRPMALPFTGCRVPHAVLEVNQECNMSCRACYKRHDRFSKPMDQILTEVELLLQKRQLTAITLAGGEPTLHPELPKVIQLLRERRLTVMMLSNGVNLDDKRLAAYRAAGLSQILLHVDCGQKRPGHPRARTEGELHELRRTLSERISRHGLKCSLAVTLYRRALPELMDMVRFVITTPSIAGALFTCCSDPQRAAVAFRGGLVLGNRYPGFQERTGLPPEQALLDSELQAQCVKLVEPQELLRRQGCEPFAMIPSNLAPRSPRWLQYYIFSIREPGGRWTSLPVSVRFQNLARLFYAFSAWLRIPNRFITAYSTKRCIVVLLLYALSCGSLRDAWAALRFLALLIKPGCSIQHKSLVFQQFPTVTSAGELEHCLDCPDATVRHGRLVPVCMADCLDPLSVDGEGSMSTKNLHSLQPTLHQ